MQQTTVGRHKPPKSLIQAQVLPSTCGGFSGAFIEQFHECEQAVERERQQHALRSIYSCPFAPAQQSSRGRSCISLGGKPYESDSRLDVVPRTEGQRSVQH